MECPFNVPEPWRQPVNGHIDRKGQGVKMRIATYPPHIQDPMQYTLGRQCKENQVTPHGLHMVPDEPDMVPHGFYMVLRISFLHFYNGKSPIFETGL